MQGRSLPIFLLLRNANRKPGSAAEELFKRLVDSTYYIFLRTVMRYRYAHGYSDTRFTSSNLLAKSTADCPSSNFTRIFSWLAVSLVRESSSNTVPVLPDPSFTTSPALGLSPLA